MLLKIRQAPNRSTIAYLRPQIAFVHDMERFLTNNAKTQAQQLSLETGQGSNIAERRALGGAASWFIAVTSVLYSRMQVEQMADIIVQ